MSRSYSNRGLILCFFLSMFACNVCYGDCEYGRSICDWYPWKSWSDCSRTCGGGRRYRSRPLCCKTGLGFSECVKQCGLSSSDSSQYGSCNTICYHGGSYDGSRCLCPDEFYSTCCSEECPRIDHCAHRKCDYSWDVKCKKCEDQGASERYSIYWPSSAETHCLPTCSWKQQWCWPGTCSDSLASSCSCEVGFKKDNNSATCDIETKADLLLCKLSVQDERGDVRQTQSGEISTSCDEEGDLFINIKPTSLTYHVTASFTREGMTPEHQYVHDTKLGIVDGKFSLKKKNLSGRETPIAHTALRGGEDCARTLNSQTPTTNLECTLTVSFTENISNGEQFCANIDVSSGGSFKYSDLGGTYRGLKLFTPVVNKKVLCFKYDNVPPEHCSASKSCKTQPLQLSSRVTNTGEITVTVTGWTDPFPHLGTWAQASGIDFYKINVYGVKTLDPKKLDVDYSTSVFSSKTLNGDFVIHINLTVQPKMYVTYLGTHDVAGNVRYSRRFLLYDNKSKLKIRDNKCLCTVSASKPSKYHGQIHHGNISLDWTDRYYNDYYIHNKYFLPIKSDTADVVEGVYEQLTGVLPVTGTESVNGVTRFSFQWSRNNGTKTKWLIVPDFTQQKMSLNLDLKDGETYEVWVKAQDIMVNTIVESVVVHIDRSVPEIVDAWLVGEGTSQMYVHNDTDLSKMVLQFRAFDVHSGITSVHWTLGTLYAATDVGTGALPVIRFDVNCPSDANCYCPDVGPCEYQNYTLTLDSLVARGQHNRTYYFTLYVANRAMLESFEHLEVLVNDSRPVENSDQEGAEGYYIGSALGVVLLALLAFAVIVVMKRKKKMCFQKQHRSGQSLNAARTNPAHDSHTTEVQGSMSLGELRLPSEIPTYETFTRENDPAQPYLSVSCVGPVDKPTIPVYETIKVEPDQTQQAHASKAQTYENVELESDQTQPNMSPKFVVLADTSKSHTYENVELKTEQGQ